MSEMKPERCPTCDDYTVCGDDWHCLHESCETQLADASSRLATLEGERDELQKQNRIITLSTQLEEDLSAKIDEMLKHLAMQDGFTLNGIARLLVECQKRMTVDWVEIGNLRRELKAQLATLEGEKAALEAALAECYRLTGADPDSNEDWLLATHAVLEVARLRTEHDEAEARAEAAEARLTAYGQHKWSCGVFHEPPFSKPVLENGQMRGLVSMSEDERRAFIEARKCTCGFDEALATAKQSERV